MKYRDRWPDSPQVQVVVVKTDSERSKLDSERRWIRQLRRDSEGDSSSGIVSRKLKVGNRYVGHVGHSGQREILQRQAYISGSSDGRGKEGEEENCDETNLDEIEFVGGNESECLGLDIVRL